MQLFPHALIRLGGESFEDWSQFDFSASNGLITEILKLKNEQQVAKRQLCDELFTFISESADPDAQNAVQNIRRDIYNERKLKNSKVNRACEYLPDELEKTLRSYLKSLQLIKEKEQEGEGIYKADLRNGRDLLKQVVGSQQLRKGLILSSKTLFDRLDSFVERPSDNFRKKENQIEQSLLQYLTRMYAKTSPFSTFTNLAIGKFDTDTEGFNMSSNSDQPVKGHIRLNNYLLKYITDLLKNYRDSYLQFDLRCNPTLQQREDHFLFLTNHNNIESFQRIPYNPVVEHIAGTVSGAADSITFKSLIVKLQEDIDADEEELEGYIKQLIDFGLLEYNIGVSGIDPDWDLKLIDALQVQVNANVTHIKELLDVLGEIRLLGQNYGNAEALHRYAILQDAYNLFRGVCMKIHEEAGLPAEERLTDKERLEKWKQEKGKDKSGDDQADDKAGDSEDEDSKEEKAFKHETTTRFSHKPEQMFYEDTTREINANLDYDEVLKVIETLGDLLNHMRFFSGSEGEKRKMTDYFSSKYKVGEVVDLLTFYEDYFRDFKKPEKEREEKLKEALKKKREIDDQSEDLSITDDNTNVSQTTEQTDENLKDKKALQWRRRLEEHLSDLYVKGKDEIDFDLGLVQAANNEIEYSDVGQKEKSYGSFLQFYHEDGKLKACVNGSFPGYGKMISRFLHIFDSSVTNDTREWNRSLCGESSLFVEDCDGSYFNANLHPPLMPYEIWMPGGHNSLPVDKQLPITDFGVVFDEQADQLNLIHRETGKQAHVFDLGFQGHMGRSQLFQLLEKFTDAEYLFTQPLSNAINHYIEKENKASETEKERPSIKVLPRISFSDTLILQRKTWIVPKTELPKRSTQDSDWHYFKSVNIWRRSVGMPDEIFVYVNTSRWGDDGIDKELLKKLTRDDYKPQYIDFRNPLLINLLEKLIDKVPLHMKVTEMLPSSEQMLKVDDRRFVSEFVVQWYNK